MSIQEKYELTTEAMDQVTIGVIRKIRNAGDLTSPEGRMVFAIFEQAVKDAMWEPRKDDLERAKNPACVAAKRRILEGEQCKRDARQWFGSPLCAHYLGLVGIDYQYAIDKVGRLMRLREAA